MTLPTRWSFTLNLNAGTMDVGGLSIVIERNFESGRFEAPE